MRKIVCNFPKMKSNNCSAIFSKISTLFSVNFSVDFILLYTNWQNNYKTYLNELCYDLLPPLFPDRDRERERERECRKRRDLRTREQREYYIMYYHHVNVRRKKIGNYQVFLLQLLLVAVRLRKCLVYLDIQYLTFSR